MLRKIINNQAEQLQDPFENVPDEIISEQLISHLDLDDVSKFAQSNNRMNKLVKNANTEYKAVFLNISKDINTIKGTYSQILAALRPIQISYQEKEEKLSILENGIAHKYKKALLDNMPCRTKEELAMDSLGASFTTVIAVAAIPSVFVPTHTVLGLGLGIMAGFGTAACIAVIGYSLSMCCAMAVQETEDEIKQINQELGNKLVLRK